MLHSSRADLGVEGVYEESYDDTCRAAWPKLHHVAHTVCVKPQEDLVDAQRSVFDEVMKLLADWYVGETDDMPVAAPVGPGGRASSRADAYRCRTCRPGLQDSAMDGTEGEDNPPFLVCRAEPNLLLVRTLPARPAGLLPARGATASRAHKCEEASRAA